MNVWFFFFLFATLGFSACPYDKTKEKGRPTWETAD